MNKTAIKAFAIEARKKLIASVKDKAGLLGITSGGEGCTKPEQKGAGFEVYRTHAGTENKIFEKEMKQRQSLVNQIDEKGYDHVIEEVAYTWFNRIIAIRFMEVNDYLPTRVRVLSSDTKHKTEPDIVNQAPDINLDFTDPEKEKIYTMKAENKLDELFSMLFIKQCNKLGEILPEIFEKVSDYTELLLNVSYTNQDGVIHMLIDNIEEDDFKEAVEIIGWLYQYYNTELKDDTFAMLKKNVKIAKERIPAATQLFTPDWIVRYMVENSLGRLWVEHLQAENKEDNNDKINSIKSNWKYYLDEAEQEDDVHLELDKLRESYKDLNPEDIKIIDPCMGSGHIIVYAFDVFMNIYKECGYSERDAAKLIIQKNLYGLEIDDRAYQLAYFAVMMKGRKYDRRFLIKEIKPNLCSIQESKTLEPFEQGAGQQKLNDIYKETANYLINVFKDAKEYGSVLNIEQRDYDGLLAYIEELKQNGAEDLFISIWLNKISSLLPVLIKQAKLMVMKYEVVITNPPYMGNSGMNTTLSDYVKKNYPDTKSDLFACFIEKGLSMAKINGYNCMVTMQSWMFLSSFENMRKKIIRLKSIINLMHMGNMVMDIAFGTAVAVFKNIHVKNFKGTYNQIKFVDIGKDNQPTSFPVQDNRFSQISTENFSKIPGMPIAYWVRESTFNAYTSLKSLRHYCAVKNGMSTTDNVRFTRMWYEVRFKNIGIGFSNATDASVSEKKWFPYNKGGEFRKWYGNIGIVVNWQYDGKEIKKAAEGASGGRIVSQEYYFMRSVSWSKVTSGQFVLRMYPDGFIFDVAGPSIFAHYDMQLYIMGLMNSKVKINCLQELYPTINFEMGQVSSFPVNYNETNQQTIIDIVNSCYFISKTDWDFFETSWDFQKHPFLTYCPKETSSMRTYYQDDDGHMKDIELVLNKNKIESCYIVWDMETTANFEQLKSNEEELNRIFIEIYDLQDELTPEVEDKNVTIRKADLSRDIRSFISYAVGCIFGRFSLDVEGIVYAGGEWEDAVESGKYKISPPVPDNILSITDEEYFEGDIVGLFVKFVKIIYSEETLEENLDFIAQALGNKGVSSREIIRNYFIKDFYKDHLKVYKKRPIYWQFDSGKENGFKALIYIHRYNQDTVGRVRADYLHKTQSAIENTIKSADYVIETTSNNVEKSKATKAREKYIKQLGETRVYDEAMAHIAHQRIEIDLDDGVKENYAKFQGVEVSSEGKKSQKVNLLTTI